MMNYYQELTIIKTPEISPYFIWSKLFTQIHLALVEQAKASHGEGAKKSDIGVSFPEYHELKKKEEVITLLGFKLRAFANTEEELTSLNLNKWCERLLDYVHIKSIAPTPTTHKYVTVKRVQQVKNNDRLTRSFAKRKKLSFEEAKTKRIELYAERHQISLEESVKHYDNPELEKWPYIKIQSLNSKHQLSLEIAQTEMESQNQGTFSTYGLSSTTTVPHW